MELIPSYRYLEYDDACLTRFVYSGTTPVYKLLSLGLVHVRNMTCDGKDIALSMIR